MTLVATFEANYLCVVFVVQLSWSCEMEIVFRPY